MPDEKKDQGTPENPQDLKGLEYQEMLKEVTSVTPREPGEILEPETVTIVEHVLLSSSPPPGMVFHPNLSLACVAGASLEAVNRVRQERNANPKKSSRMMWLRVGKDFLRVYFEWLNLTEEDIKDINPRTTFRIVGVTDYDGNPIEKTNVDVLIDEKISAVRKKEERELMGRLRGKIPIGSS